MNIDFTSKKVHIYPYNSDQEVDATKFYAGLEKKVEDSKNAVVLVSVPKMKELQDAYPSYFLDTRDFLTAIDTMKSNCIKWGYVEAKK